MDNDQLRQLLEGVAQAISNGNTAVVTALAAALPEAPAPQELPPTPVAPPAVAVPFAAAPGLANPGAIIDYTTTVGIKLFQ